MQNNNEIDQLNTWLGGLDVGVNPSLKINHGFMNAAVVVDFGVPIEPVRLTNEQSMELSNKMRDLAANLTNRKNIRINYDNQNGVYWTSVV